MNKIFIVGCAKSGTTMFRRLFHSFENVQVVRDETGIYDFAKAIPNENTTLIGKRRWDTLYSSSRLSIQEIKIQRKLLKNMFVINIVRDGRAVINSYMKDWKMNGTLDWCESLRQVDEYPELIDLTIKYEDLLQKPDEIQQQIIELTGLVPEYKFSDYPKFMTPVTISEVHGENYLPRPLDPSRIEPDSSWRKIKPNDMEVFEYYLQKYNYI